MTLLHLLRCHRLAKAVAAGLSALAFATPALAADAPAPPALQLPARSAVPWLAAAPAGGAASAPEPKPAPQLCIREGESCGAPQQAKCCAGLICIGSRAMLCVSGA